MDEIVAFRNFERDYLLITAHNATGNASFTCDFWDKSDLSFANKTKFLNGLAPLDKMKMVTGKAAGPDLNLTNAPSQWDWRPIGVDWLPVRDQGYYCGACWAFSATDALAAILFKQTGRRLAMSEQNLIDCNKNIKTGNWGCTVS